MRPQYPTDISRQEYETVAEMLKMKYQRYMRRREHQTYHIFCAVLYILGTKEPWRMLPKEFEIPWGTVYHNFKVWRETDALNEVLVKLGRLKEAEYAQTLKGGPRPKVTKL